MTTEDAATQDGGDKEVRALELHKTGRITIHDFEEKRSWTLRLPKFGEFKAIKRKAGELAKMGVELQEKYDLKGVDLNDPKVAVDRFDDLDAMGDEMVERTGDVLIETVKKLYVDGDDPTNLAIDDLPAWALVNAGVVDAMVKHWRTVPLGRG